MLNRNEEFLTWNQSQHVLHCSLWYELYYPDSVCFHTTLHLENPGFHRWSPQYWENVFCFSAAWSCNQFYYTAESKERQQSADDSTAECSTPRDTWVQYRLRQYLLPILSNWFWLNQRIISFWFDGLRVLTDEGSGEEFPETVAPEPITASLTHYITITWSKSISDDWVHTGGRHSHLHTCQDPAQTEGALHTWTTCSLSYCVLYKLASHVEMISWFISFCLHWFFNCSVYFLLF